MSKELVLITNKFLIGEISAIDFVEIYIEKWRSERNAGLLLKDEPNLSETLSTIFCYADLFNPENDREPYEYDECTLKNNIKKLIAEKKLFFYQD
ncbi:colicin immunity domain-containing protein [Massilia sp. W12]|uniref:colicin immunity domain-containing protein n=1 Tax=Massilia sp. W12 TaxID=3126507 RepID=UPI0030D399CF